MMPALKPLQKKTLIAAAVCILLLLSFLQFYASSTITINGRPVTGIGSAVLAYLALFAGLILLVVVVPSLFFFIAAASVVLILGLFFFFPLMPLVYLLMPGLIVAALLYYLYRRLAKKEQ